MFLVPDLKLNTGLPSKLNMGLMGEGGSIPHLADSSSQKKEEPPRYLNSNCIVTD